MSKRSGTQYTEAELLARGVASVKLRVSVEHKERLRRLADGKGVSQSDLVESWIDREWPKR